MGSNPTLSASKQKRDPSGPVFVYRTAVMDANPPVQTERGKAARQTHEVRPEGVRSEATNQSHPLSTTPLKINPHRPASQPRRSRADCPLRLEDSFTVQVLDLLLHRMCRRPNQLGHSGVIALTPSSTSIGCQKLCPSGILLRPRYLVSGIRCFLRSFPGSAPTRNRDRKQSGCTR